MKLNYRLIEAIFIDRPNRFLTRVKLGGKVIESHLPDPGRLRELLIPGVKVLIKEEDGEHRRTKYSTQAVYYNKKLISLNTLLPNKYSEYLINNNKLDFLDEWHIFKKEATCGNSRFDFKLQNKNQFMYLEVKSVTLVENKIAYFPDSVTVRGTKHVKHLGDLASKGKHSMVLFVIQRHDATLFQPKWDRDPKFGYALFNAWEKGLKVRAIHSKITKSKIHYLGEIPVELNPII